MTEKAKIEVPKLPALMRLLNGNELYAAPWKKALLAIANVTEQLAIARAPLRGGQTIAKMSYKVQNRPVPHYFVVKTTARNPRNRYPYPKLQEYWGRSRHQGWFRGAFTGARGAWEGLLDRAAEEIKSIWRGL